MFKKKETKVLDPQYYLSATHMQTINYKVYYMSKLEKIVYFIAAFLIGAVVGYIFYGGIGKNQYGEPTILMYILNTVISSIIGVIVGKIYLPIRQNQILEKRQKQLRLQFRDMLEALATSMGAGKNVTDSFQSVYGDMKMQYDENAFIVQELSVINNGIKNGITVEETLEDFGKRSGCEDIVSFASVFEVCYRKGGNIRDVIQNTYEILNDKMEIQEDITTVVTSSKSEQTIMLIMPVLLIAMIKFASDDFASNFTTITGIISTTVSIGIFIASYFIGKKILHIEV